MSHMQSLSDHLLLAFAFSFIVTFLPLYYTVGPYSLLYNNRLMYILFHILFYNDIAVLLLLGVDHIFIVAYFIHRTIRWHLKDCNCSLRLSWYGHQVALDPAEPINVVNPSLKFLLLHCIWQRYQFLVPFSPPLGNVKSFLSFTPLNELVTCSFLRAKETTLWKECLQKVSITSSIKK